VLASAVRTAGQGFEVLVVQLFQSSRQGVVNLCQRLTWLRCVSDRYLDKPDTVLKEAEVSAMGALWQTIEQAVRSGAYRLVVIEGVDLALHHGIVTETQVLQLLGDRPLNMDIVLTAESLPASILEIADQVTKRRS
jgi:cob(I)alamin adenosyltransferase